MLAELDARLEATGLFFVRCMDDLVVLAPTRHELRRTVRIVNQTFAELGLEKTHPETFIGRVERGFSGSSPPPRPARRLAESVSNPNPTNGPVPGFADDD